MITDWRKTRYTTAARNSDWEPLVFALTHIWRLKKKEKVSILFYVQVSSFRLVSPETATRKNSEKPSRIACIFYLVNHITWL